jgi:hypothetical protein
MPFVSGKLDLACGSRSRYWPDAIIETLMSTSFVLCGSLLLLSVALPLKAASVRFIDSGYEIARGADVTPSVYWIDDHRLMFLGFKATEIDAPAGKDPSSGRRLKKLFIWDVRRPVAEEYASADSLCYSDGWVSYRTAVDQSRAIETVREGPLGAEQETTKPFLSFGEVRSNFTCKRHAVAHLVPPASRNRRIVVLRKGDGYLDLGPSLGIKIEGEPRTVRLYSGKTGQPISLPIVWEENVAQYDVAYSAYQDAYVLRPKRPGNGSRQWPEALPLRVYLLRNNGDLEKVSAPHQPARYLNKPQPTVAGWIFGGGDFHKAAGLYLFDGTVVSQLDKGLVQDIAVSPNGCAAAVGIQNKHLEMGTPVKVRVLQFCLDRN